MASGGVKVGTEIRASNQSTGIGSLKTTDSLIVPFWLVKPCAEDKAVLFIHYVMSSSGWSIPVLKNKKKLVAGVELRACLSSLQKCQHGTLPNKNAQGLAT